MTAQDTSDIIRAEKVSDEGLAALISVWECWKAPDSDDVLTALRELQLLRTSLPASGRQTDERVIPLSEIEKWARDHPEEVWPDDPSAAPPEREGLERDAALLQECIAVLQVWDEGLDAQDGEDYRRAVEAWDALMAKIAARSQPPEEGK